MKNPTQSSGQNGQLVHWWWCWFTVALSRLHCLLHLVFHWKNGRKARNYHHHHRLLVFGSGGAVSPVNGGLSSTGKHMPTSSLFGTQTIIILSVVWLSVRPQMKTPFVWWECDGTVMAMQTSHVIMSILSHPDEEMWWTRTG